MLVTGRYKKFISLTDLLPCVMVDTGILLTLCYMPCLTQQVDTVLSCRPIILCKADTDVSCRYIIMLSHQMPVSSRPSTLNHITHSCLLLTLYLVPKCTAVTCRPFPLCHKRVMFPADRSPYTTVVTGFPCRLFTFVP